MDTFKCRIVDYDGDDEWTEVTAYDAEDAACKYTEECQDNGAGEILNSENDSVIVVVRDKDGNATKWRTSFYVSYDYQAFEVDDE